MRNNYDNTVECKYTWNDLVIIKKEAPAKFHPGEIGVVCGMSKIQFEEVANKYGSQVGDWICTVEFGDGSDMQVPKNYLEPYFEKTDQ